MADLTVSSAVDTLMQAANQAGIRSAAGLIIGTDVQAHNDNLAAFAGLTSAADKLPYFTGSGTAAVADFTAAGRELLNDANAAAQRSTLSLGSTDLVTFLAQVLSGQSLTAAEATSLLDMSATWNTTGTPTAIRLNITDTASSALSLLMDLRVGGTSRFSIRKDGIVVPSTISSASNIITTATGRFGTLHVGSTDVVLGRDAANVLAQRNDTNAQEFRLYNTYTDSSNYERGGIRWNSNELQLVTDNAGTGSQRNIRIGIASSPRLFITQSGVVTSGNFGHSGGAFTISTNPVFNPTWNNVATTFTALQVNVTDTASDAASLLADFQVGGTSRFAFRKDGRLDLSFGGATNPSTFSTPAISLGGVTNSGIGRVAGGVFTSVAGVTAFVVNQGSIRIKASLPFGFSSSEDPTTAGNDVQLWRDAANTLGQRNGVAAQAFNIYNTYTDASNYERACIKWSSNVAVLSSEALGTGTARSLGFESGGSVRWRINTSGHFESVVNRGSDFGQTGSRARFLYARYCNLEDFVELAQEISEPAAPAANAARIFLQDNGAGKTQLMVRFASGASQQIAIEP
jgi:hypothetical protein